VKRASTPSAQTATHQASPVIQKLRDWMLSATAEVENNRTTVEGLIERRGMSRRRAVNLLRALADAGYGEFKLGRKGHPSRFEWADDPQTLAKQLAAIEEVVEVVEVVGDEDDLDDQDDQQPDSGEMVLEMFPHARGKPITTEPASESPASVDPSEASEASDPSEAIEHSYVLRPDLRVVVQLPRDLTAREAEVLGDWVRNLSFDR